MSTGLRATLGISRKIWLLLPAGVLAAGLAATLWLGSVARTAADKQDDERLHRLSGQAEALVRDRLETYTDALFGGAALLSASESVSRDEWRRYVENLDLPGRYPGIEGMGVVYAVSAHDLPSFESEQRASLPGFETRPVPGFFSGDARFVVTYLEPREPNSAAIGLDLASEPARHAAAELARNTGQPQVTGRIVLVTDNQSRPGFLLFVPVYRPGMPQQTLAERHAAFVGWVYAPFITTEFLAGALGQLDGEVDAHVYQQLGGATREQVYDSSGNAPGQAQPAEVRHVATAGQLFTIEIGRGPEFAAASRTPEQAIFIGGVAVAALLAFLVKRLQDSGDRAWLIAQRRTAELQRALAFQRGILDSAGNAIVVTGLDGMILIFNPAAEDLLGYRADQVIGRHSPAIFLDDAELRERAARLSEQLGHPVSPGIDALVALARTGATDCREWTLRRADHTSVPVSMTLTMLRNAAGEPAGYLGIARDITPARRAEAEIRESEARFRAIFDLSIDMFAIVDARGNLLRTNPAWERVLGHPGEALVGQPIWPLVHPDDLAEGKERVRPAVDGAEVHDSRARVRHADGSWRWLSFNLSGIGPGGEAYVAARDVTAEVEARHELEQLVEALRESSSTLAAQNAELERLRAQAEHSANHDVLTGTLNRRAWFAAATATKPTAIAIFDLDHFKNVNDTHGHTIGDAVLREVAQRLQSALPKSAYLGRLGGEEFAVLFSGPISEVRTAANRCIDVVAAAPIVLPGGPQIVVTVSGGLAPWRPGLHSREESLIATYDAADRALYDAKRSGRYRLVIDKAA